MTTQIIKTAEAAHIFAALLDKVRYKKQSFAIQKGKEVIAKIVPPEPEAVFPINQLNNLFFHPQQIPLFYRFRTVRNN